MLLMAMIPLIGSSLTALGAFALFLATIRLGQAPRSKLQ
jgi:hypothetical protein